MRIPVITLASTLFEMDASAFWTMIGTLVALGLGVYPHWIKWFKRPVLNLDFEGAVKASGTISMTYEVGGQSHQETNFCVRIPVRNQVGRDDAVGVEVWLDELWVLKNGNKEEAIPYLPLRFEWTHTENEYASGSLTGGSRRLLNIGYVRPYTSTLALATEYPHDLKPGKYEVVLRTTCPGTQHVDARFEMAFSIPAGGVSWRMDACKFFKLTFLG